MSPPLHTTRKAEEIMAYNTFKFHVRHGDSDQFRKGVGHLHIEDETIRFDLPVKSEEQIQTAPAIRNVMLCDRSKCLREALRTWTLPVAVDFSRLPMSLAFSLIILMFPVSVTLPWEWIFKGIAIAGCVFYSLAVPFVRLLIEFEDDTYVCGDIDHRVLDAHHMRILEGRTK